LSTKINDTDRAADVADGICIPNVTAYPFGWGHVTGRFENVAIGFFDESVNAVITFDLEVTAPDFNRDNRLWIVGPGVTFSGYHDVQSS
jgi:hypothetical protein